MRFCGSGSAAIPVDGDTEVGHWVRGRSKTRDTPLHALEVDGQPKSVFVADQLLIDPSDEDVLSELIERHGARIVPSLPVPSPPYGLVSAETGPSGIPLPVVLFVPDAPDPSRHSTEILRAAFGRDFSVTADSAARLLSLAAGYISSGKQVGLNLLASQADFVVVGSRRILPAGPADVGGVYR